MSLVEYHKSITLELITVTNKVRNLIDHWPEDGRYKEVTLKNIIRRFLPEKYQIGTGFIIKQTQDRGNHLKSKQIDLIIYEDSSPILFKEGDFVILTPDSVKGIIEVKANLKNQNLTDVIKQANENGQFIFEGKLNKEDKIFNGVFSYEGYDNAFDTDVFKTNYLKADIPNISNPDFNKFKVNHVSLNKDWFLKYWPNDALPQSLYNIQDLSFSFFIYNLIDMISDKSVDRNKFIWFTTDKELDLKIKF